MAEQPYRTVVRPRKGDLEAATQPHTFVPSGEFLQFGNRMERCDLCGLIQRGTRMHPEPACAEPPLSDNEGAPEQPRQRTPSRPSPRWELAPDRRALTVVRDEPDGSRVVQYQWAEPASEEQISAALRDRPLPRMTPGERRTTRRRRLPFGFTLYLHFMAGPPTWWWPHLFVHERSVVTGWLRRAVAVRVCRVPNPPSRSDAR